MSEPLEQAIAIWKDRAAGTHNYTSCPLCEAYLGCQGCPIYLKTGRDSCRSTPYYRYDNARRMDARDTMKREASDMLALLESCRS